jgi:hypothetical protein
VLTRRPTPDGDHCATLIANNHGRAAQGVMGYLTDPVKMYQLGAYLQATNKLPYHFQVIFEVTISKENGEADIESVLPVAARLYP